MILTEEPFRQPRVRELLGPRDYTMAEAARVLGAAIGKPDLGYAQLPYEHAHAAMVDSGTSASFAAAVMQTARSFNDGQAWDTEPRSPAHTTRTTLEQFAHTTALAVPTSADQAAIDRHFNPRHQPGCCRPGCWPGPWTRPSLFG